MSTLAPSGDNANSFPTPGATYDGVIQCVHVLGHPDRPMDVTRHPGDAQVFNCHNFCQLLSRAGVPHVYYGVTGSQVPSGGRMVDLGPPAGTWEHGNDWHREYTARVDQVLDLETERLGNVPQAIAAIYGCAQADIQTPERRDLPVIEPMVGYGHCWAPYRVFPSYAQQSVIYASRSETVQSAIWFDTVIPHFVNANDYGVRAGEKRYALFIGREATDKGAHIAKYICDRAGMPLRVVHNGVGGREKAELIAGAIALFAPTLYLEPFGYVAIEAQMCGVPAITTDWGAFAETVEHGRTGFRCRTAAEFVRALEQAPQLDSGYIRSRAVSLYSIGAVSEAYLSYFDFVWEVHRNGGYYAPAALRLPASFSVRGGGETQNGGA